MRARPRKNTAGFTPHENTPNPRGAPCRVGGFTVLEIIVATSLFIVVIGVSGGIFTTFVGKHRELIARESVQEELQSFFEQLDREVRTGFGATFDDSTVGEFFLKNQNAECVKYGVVSERLMRATSTASGCELVPGTVVLSTGDPLTARLTVITELRFAHTKKPSVVTGLLSGRQGRVTVSVLACPKYGEATDCVRAQSTLTSRQYGSP